MFVRNAWYVAAWSDDLVDGQLLARTIMKEPVVLYRKADGNVSRAAEESGEYRKKMARLIKKHGLGAVRSEAMQGSPITEQQRVEP